MTTQEALLEHLFLGVRDEQANFIMGFRVFAD